MYRSLARAPQAPAAPDSHGSRAPLRGPTSPGTALERLRTLFGLSSFERDLLVLCAGPSLESRFISGCAAALNDARVAWPTFGLALAVLDDPHWSAVSPARPLRYWQLLDVDRGNLLHAPLRIDERILQFLIGVPAFDERLQALARPILADSAPADAEAFRAAAGGQRRRPSLGAIRHRARAAPADRRAPFHPAGRLRRHLPAQRPAAVLARRQRHPRRGHRA